MAETQKIKNFPKEQKIEVILRILKNSNHNYFDISTDVKARKLIDSFATEMGTKRYSNERDLIISALHTYNMYTADNLIKFLCDPEIINYAINSDKYNDIKIAFSKKQIRTFKDDAWKNVEYEAPAVDTEALKYEKLEKDYCGFGINVQTYKIHKYNPKNSIAETEQVFLIYDKSDPKNLSRVYEFPISNSYFDKNEFITMCKVHWCKENEFNLRDKFADAGIITIDKYCDNILNIK